MIEKYTDEQIIQILKDSGAIKHGHFKLTSGCHSDTYVQCAQLMVSPTKTIGLARQAILRMPKDVVSNIDLVVSPAVGGVTWGFAVAYVLGTDFVFCERVDGKMTLRRSFEIPQGSHVLIAEDVVTTGGSVNEVGKVAEGAGASIQGVCSIIQRGKQPVFNWPLHPLIKLEVASWEPEDCKMCAAGQSITVPGSRALSK